MTALSASKKIIKVDGPEFLRKVPVDADMKIYHGALVGKVSGYARPATTGADKVIGVANLSHWDDQDATGQASVIGRTSGNLIDTTGLAAGARHLIVEVGCFKFANKGGDLVDETMIGDDCYVEDDATVRKTAAATITAGTVIGLDDDGGVFVRVGGYGRA
jgi:hypothetical protein